MEQPAIHFSRRTFLAVFGMGAAGTLTIADSTTARAQTISLDESGPRAWRASRSANGWPVNAAAGTFRVEGTDLDIVLASGSASVVLLHALRRLNYELDTLRPGDLVGGTSDRNVLSPERSNLLSGTAVLFRPGHFPYGTPDNLYPEQILVLEDIVTESAGVLAWGGHLATPDQGLIYVRTPPINANLARVVRRFEDTDRMDTEGGVGQIDVFSSDR